MLFYAIGTKYKCFAAFEEVENHEERCKLKQSTVSSTGYKWDVPQTFKYKTLAPDAHSFDKWHLSSVCGRNSLSQHLDKI